TMSPPVGGLFWFQIFIQVPSRKFGQKRFLAVRRSWRGNGVACFWATSLEKIFGGVVAIISFRPGGGMQQCGVPRCAILSVGSREASGSETARVHHAVRRRSSVAHRCGPREARDDSQTSVDPALTHAQMRAVPADSVMAVPERRAAA